MPTFVHGKDTDVYIGGYDFGSYLKSTSVAASVETADVTCYGASDKSYIGGLVNTTVQHEGVVAGGTQEADEAVSGLLGGTAQTWSFYIGGDTVANEGYASPALPTSYSPGAEVGDAAKFSLEGQTSAPVDRVLSLRARATSSATAAGTNVDGGAGGSNGGWAAYIHVVSGTASAATCIVEHSVDGATSWATLATFSIPGTAAVGGIGSNYSEGSGTVRRYVRHNLTALTGTVNFQVGFARR